MAAHGGKQSVFRPFPRPAVSVASIGSICQPRQRRSRQTFQSGENRFEFPLLLCGGFIERRRFGGELHVDGRAVGLISPFEVRAVAFGWIVVAGALRPAALHRPLQDGAFQKVLKLEKFPPGLAEALGLGAENNGAGRFFRGHDRYCLCPTVLIP